MPPHRADICTPTHVIELQASSISSAEIAERERFYMLAHGNMVWLLNGDDFRDNLNIRERGSHVTFRWKHPRKSWFQAMCPLFIDLHDEGILEVQQLYTNRRCAGWGYIITAGQFIAMHK
jgi:competence CoiA-like predicted nuclease